MSLGMLQNTLFSSLSYTKRNVAKSAHKITPPGLLNKFTKRAVHLSREEFSTMVLKLQLESKNVSGFDECLAVCKLCLCEGEHTF